MMKTNLTRTLFVATLTMTPWMLVGPSPAATQSMEEEKSLMFQRSLDQIATDSTEDNLKACLARIPSDASAGQNMLAVDTCKKEDMLRSQTITSF